MKALKLIVSLAVAVCALCNAHAQTNTVNFTGTMTLQGLPPTSSSAVTRSSALNTAGLIAELGHATGNTNFTRAAKLMYVSGNTNQFAISEGTNFVLIATNIISLNPTTGNSVVSGAETSTSLHEKELMIFELDFDDVGVGSGGSNLKFSLRGLGDITVMATQTSTSTSAKITLVGDGTQGGTNLVATASISGSGK